MDSLSSFSSKDTTVKNRGEHEFFDDKGRIDLLADLIEKGSRNPTVYELTRRLLNAKKIKSYDDIGEIKAIHDWVRDNITYRNHIMCRDTFQGAERTIDLRSGDCDQASVLVCSMLMSLSIPTGLRIISTSHARPFHHIYSLAGNPKKDPSKWIPLDTINKSAPAGWEPRYVKKKDYRIFCE